MTKVYSTKNEGKSVIAERPVRTVKNEIYKYVSLVWRNLSVHKLFYRYLSDNNKMNADVYIENISKSEGRKLAFNCDDLVRMSGCNCILVKDYIPNWNKVVYIVKVVNDTNLDQCNWRLKCLCAKRIVLWTRIVENVLSWSTRRKF